MSHMSYIQFILSRIMAEASRAFLLTAAGCAVSLLLEIIPRMKSVIRSNVVGFLRFPPIGKVVCGDLALVSKLNKEN